jgi:hypothetical protein
MEFKGFTLFKIGAVLDRSNSKTEVWKPLTISIGNGERDLSLHGLTPLKIEAQNR